ncbi:MAG TPA: VOC family protein [Tepidisphaeraceae bacterium]|jgi:lactoylglutathione lyase
MNKRPARRGTFGGHASFASYSWLALVAFAAIATVGRADDAPSAAMPQRPRIAGLSHVALWVKDIDRSRAFFKDYLGFDEPYSLKDADGKLHLTFIKINDRQSIELFPYNDKKPDNADNLYHVAFETDDAAAMHDYLAANGVHGPGGKPLAKRGGTGKIGNMNFFVEDPDGHIIEIVQYMPDGWTRRDAGKHVPPTRVSTHMSHAGITVGDLAASMHFYRGILGFKEFWRGSKDGTTLSWVNLRVPEGNDYLELMLYEKTPNPDRLHTLNHLCLEVPDVPKARATLAERPLPEGCKALAQPQIGRNQKRQLNCYDPDGTRVEIMEDHTVTGEPAPSATQLPPVRAQQN